MARYALLFQSCSLLSHAALGYTMYKSNYVPDYLEFFL